MGFPVCWVTMKCEGDGEQLPRLLSVPICALWEHSAFLVPLEVASVASSIPWAAGDACMAVDVAGQGRGRGARKGVVRRVVGVPSHAACAGGSWIDVPGGDGDAAGTGGRGGESRERGGQEAAQVSHRLDPWVRCWAGPEVGRERGQAAMPDDHAAGTAAENEMAGPSREEHFCGAVTHQQGIAELACRGRTEETRGEGETGGGQTDESVTALKVADAVAGRGLVAGPGEWEGTLPPFAIVLNRGDSVDFASYSDFRADEVGRASFTLPDHSGVLVCRGR